MQDRVGLVGVLLQLLDRFRVFAGFKLQVTGDVMIRRPELLAVLAAVYFGAPIAESSIAGWFTFSKESLSIILPVYGFSAAALPVWLLLAPRDYLSTYMKIAVIGGMALGLFLVNPTVQMPFVTQFIAVK